MLENINLSGFLFLAVCFIFFSMDLAQKKLIKPIYLKLYHGITGKRLYKFSYTTEELNNSYFVFDYIWFKTDKDALRFGKRMHKIEQVYPKFRVIKNDQEDFNYGEYHKKYFGSRISMQVR